MMAKMFYTAEETQTALGRSAEDIKQLTREGKLREFRDGAKVMYKADQVEQLKGEIGGGGEGDAIDLGPSDTSGPLGLADSSSGTKSGSMIGLSDTGSGSPLSKEDTATDIGLSASNTGTSIPLSGSLTGGSMGGSMTGSRGAGGSGVNVLGLDESHGADPSAQTAVTQSFGDQGVNLEAMGSGSGLLDLSRESDDTSLGKAVIDEISAGSRAGGSAVSGPALVGGVRGVPLVVEAHDPFAAAFGLAALGACVMTIIALIALAAVAGHAPIASNLIAPLAVEAGANNTAGTVRPMWLLLVIGAGVSGVLFVAGMLFGRKR